MRAITSRISATERDAMRTDVRRGRAPEILPRRPPPFSLTVERRDSSSTSGGQGFYLHSRIALNRDSARGESTDEENDEGRFLLVFNFKLGNYKFTNCV